MYYMETKSINLILSIIILFLLFHLSKKTTEHFIPFEVLTKYKHIDRLSKLLKLTHEVLESNNIEYWMCGGTLLGAVRDKGIIPWDDDGDICILDKHYNDLKKLEKELKNYGLGMSKWGCGFKVYDLKGDKLPGKNFLFPFVDIFMCKEEDDKIYLSAKQCAKAWPAEYHMKNELFPLKLYDFEDYKMWGPNKPNKYLSRSYKDWRKKGMRNYDHETHKELPKTEFEISYCKKKKPFLWQYWDTIDGKETPDFIKLCLKTVDKHCSNSFDIVRLNKDNIYKYIPEIEKYKDKMKDLIIAHKVDIYRIMLLYKFGGIYMDADLICLRDPIEIVQKLNKYDFVGFGCTGAKCSYGYGQPSNWLLASRPNSLLMASVLKHLLNKIEKQDKFSYHDLGKMVIWEELTKLIKEDNYEYFHYPNKFDGSRDINGAWVSSDIVFSDKKVEYEDEKNMMFFVFYSSDMEADVKKMSEKELLSKDWVYTKFLKRALDMK